MSNRKIFAVILAVPLCGLIVLAHEPQGEKEDQKTGVDTPSIGVAKGKESKKDKKRRWVGVFDRAEDLRGKKDKKRHKLGLDQKSNQTGDDVLGPNKANTKDNSKAKTKDKSKEQPNNGLANSDLQN